ncbi:MAG: repeat protein [Chlorobi bacterium]|nr:repeat protein [Chlorobiota bacterium]
MTMFSTRRFLIVFCCLAFCRVAAHAQVTTITKNPKATLLHRLWLMGDKTGTGQWVGYGGGGLGDIFGTGRNAWGVCVGKTGEWQIFTYDSSATVNPPPRAVFYGADRRPIVGDFYGTGHNVIGFSSGTKDSANNHYLHVEFHRTDSNRIDSLPSAVIDMQKTTGIRTFPDEIIGRDLDGDGADELLLYFAGTVSATKLDYDGQIWIYRGGPNFQVDSPTVILRDSERYGGRGRQKLYIGRIDGDDHIDLMTNSDYAGGIERQKIWWGRDGSPWNWSRPDTTIDFGIVWMAALDCDGDGILDWAVPGADSLYLYRSGSGHDFRHRDLARSRADAAFFCPRHQIVDNLGPLNDASRRYDMLGFGGESPVDSYGEELALAGGPNGPDAMYDAYYGGAYDGPVSGDNVINDVAPLGDINGDGWSDLLVYNFQYKFNGGIAIVVGGGPEIPRDPSLGIEAVAGEGYASAISLWPMPAHDELHIAWRGDLKKMPSSFVVHDLMGREIARGSVESWRGEALWNCAGVPPGVYMLSIFNDAGSLLHTVRLLKE